MISMDPEYEFVAEMVDGNLRFEDTPTWCSLETTRRNNAEEHIEFLQNHQPDGTVVEGVFRLTDSEEDGFEIEFTAVDRPEGGESR